ncbi:MAG: hypothetical protein GXO76_05900 [Calditrichaeota bacterium]|nr:hypothetical protein [Calditrichota bacterium]
MKLNAISNAPLYQNPKIQKSGRVVPKDVPKTGLGKNPKKPPAEKSQGTAAKLFSAQAEKILTAKEKVEIHSKFKAHSQQDVGYSRGGRVKMNPAYLGQKLDLKG